MVSVRQWEYEVSGLCFCCLAFVLPLLLSPRNIVGNCKSIKTHFHQCFRFLFQRNNSVIQSKKRHRGAAHTSLWTPLFFLFFFRGSSVVSVSGPCNNAVGGGGPHVHHHLLWLCGLSTGKHLPSADSKSGGFFICFCMNIGHIRFRALQHNQWKEE